ncbi:MAG TPA: DUF1501 domain-containing protein [Sediminibacterium sp.]|nr:DUF1501 domain-containing protein [Sediminibacterium sp.]
MKRRDFLRKSFPAGVLLPSLVSGFSFRALSAESPLVRPLLQPMMETDHVFVIIQLNGGNDGLNMVVPIENFDSYANARSNIYIPEKKLLTLNGKAGLHPAMTGLKALYDQGQLRVVQSVGYPQPNFSHFRATDIWMSASDSDQVVNSGWAGRYLNYAYPDFPNGYPNASMPDPLAIQIGSTASLTLQGPAVSMGMSITNTSNFYNLINGIQDPAPDTPAGKELTYIRMIAQQSQAYASVIKDAAANTVQQVSYPIKNALGDQLKIVARLIKGGLQTRIYMVNYGGFDTHSNQVDSTDTTIGTHAYLLQQVSDAIKAFQDDLKFLGVDQRVVGMTFSEFGRRIKSNGSTGTDHGAAAPLFIFGKRVAGGVLGDTPVIPSNVSVNDNLPFQYDFRSVYASILSKWLCVKDEDLQLILLKNFQQLSLVDGGGCQKAVNLSGETLISNYPNPFTASTIITFSTNGGHTLVQVIDPLGRVVAVLTDKDYTAGTYTLTFDSTRFGTGVYYARLQNESVQQVRPMLKVR